MRDGRHLIEMVGFGSAIGSTAPTITFSPCRNAFHEGVEYL